MRRAAIAILFLSGAAGCDLATPGGGGAESVAGPKEAPVVTVAWSGVAGASEWTAILYERIGTAAALLEATPQDAVRYCPGFLELDHTGRQAFYTELVSIMARYESGFDPEVRFQESFADSSGSPVISRGLLQLSIESADSYPGCDPESAEALHDPDMNLTCAVAILNRLVARDQAIGIEHGGGWKGGAAYWSVLRSNHPRNDEIVSFTQSLPVCAG
jgi:hypothetical protein